MTLAEVLSDIRGLRDGDVVYAVRPWSLSAEAYIFPDPGPDGNVVRFIKGTSFEYFLEVNLIHETIDAALSLGKTIPKAVEAVMYYAENDAYPEDW
ncbi:DUF7716 domain-containing protein [Roseateles chitinivorans]|uniref:DUF7716 domain-containing protein n=1 Tax=Roseateles chitinivorans TaxID=2917965 RepID=UPI003D6772B6